MRLADIKTLDDDALAVLLNNAFEELPAPAAVKLASIRDQLPSRARQAKNRRWAQIVTIGILTGSGLAAAWWGYQAVRVANSPAMQEQTVQPRSVTPPAVNDSIEPTKQNEQAGTIKQGDDRRSPVIYKQEQLP